MNERCSVSSWVETFLQVPQFLYGWCRFLQSYLFRREMFVIVQYTICSVFADSAITWENHSLSSPIIREHLKIVEKMIYPETSMFGPIIFTTRAKIPNQTAQGLLFG